MDPVQTEPTRIDLAQDSNDIILKVEECQTVKKRIVELEEKVDSLDEEIARLYAIRQGECTRLRRLHVAIAPHKGLPFEILQRIFTLSYLAHAPERVFFNFPVDCKPHLSPWNIRHVSSSWRRAAISCHTLWNKICLEWGSLKSHIPENLHAALPRRHWVRRLTNGSQILPSSGPVSVALLLNSNIPINEEMLDLANGILISPILERLESLSYEWPQVRLACLSSLHRTAFSGMHALQTLSLDIVDTPRSPRPRGGWCIGCTDLAVSGLTQLRRLDISGEAEVLTFFLRQQFLWPNLTNMQLRFVERANPRLLDWHTVARAFQKCQNLTSLHIHLDTPSDRILLNANDQNICLPRLEILTLNTFNMKILAPFVAPSLLSLEIKCRDLNSDHLTNFLRTSQCSLQSFKEIEWSKSYRPSPIPRNLFIQLVHILRTVKTFQVQTLLNVDELALIGKGRWLPNVEHLGFSTRSGPAILNLLNRRIFRSAFTSVSQIRSITAKILDHAWLDHKLRIRVSIPLTWEDEWSDVDFGDLKNHYGLDLHFSKVPPAEHKLHRIKSEPT